jgi:hypothetical protein
VSQTPDDPDIGGIEGLGPGPPPENPDQPFYKRWWVWAIVGVVLIAGAFAAGEALGNNNGVASTSATEEHDDVLGTAETTHSHTTVPHTTVPHTTQPHTTQPHTTQPHTTVPPILVPPSTEPPNTTSPSTAAAQVGPKTTFGNGTYQVGTHNDSQVAPGTYVSTGGSFCYWARLSGLGGATSDIIAYDIAMGRAIVTIESTDVGFETRGCGTWSPLPATGSQATMMGDGTWAVGIDIAPGTYSTSGDSTCYWARLSSFNGEFSSIIAYALPIGPAVVTIDPTDKGFTSKDCGTWAKTG